jgi:hypothetical protein
MYSDNLIKTNFPTDGNGKLCGIDNPTQPYLFFGNMEDRVKISLIIVSKSLRGEMP